MHRNEIFHTWAHGSLYMPSALARNPNKRGDSTVVTIAMNKEKAAVLMSRNFGLQ